jgi:outer membrane protein TolC
MSILVGKRRFRIAFGQAAGLLHFQEAVANLPDDHMVPSTIREDIVMRHRSAFALLILTLSASQAMVASAQDSRPTASSNAIVHAATAELLPPVSPAQSPGPMSLDACIELGFQYQPALAAARASLAASQSGQRGVNRMILPRLFTPDLGVRREQACHGVTIAEAALAQAEWETRYAITRNFFTVQYIRSQQVVVNDVLNTLDKGYKRAEKLYEAGDPKNKITNLDLEAIKVQIAIVKGKKSQADNGMLKAKAALREAMGLGHDYPLEIVAVDLPVAVYPTKYYEEKVKDDKGKDTGKTVKKEFEYRILLEIKKVELIDAAIANRGEIIQANAASRVTDLEIQAQGRIRGWQGRTFASGADPHTQPIPFSIFNSDYRPGAIGLEMPPMLAGRRWDRVQRARDLNDRASAVVEKTNNLVSLDVEAQYLKWRESAEEVQYLKEIYETAQELPDKVLTLVQGKDLTSTQIIQANMTAIMVRTSLNEEMHTHALALAGLERATAGAFRVYPIPAAPPPVLVPPPKKK